MADSSKEGGGKGLLHQLRALRDQVAADNERDETQAKTKLSSSKASFSKPEEAGRRYNLRSRPVDKQTGTSLTPRPTQRGQDTHGALRSPRQGQDAVSIPRPQKQGQNTSGDGGGKATVDQGGKPSGWALVDRPGTWKPPIAIGDSLGENLSKIELADRKVEQWRAIADYHREHLPEALAKVQESLDAAIRERNKLADTAENRTPRNELASTSKHLIDSRIAGLRTVLADSLFPPEKANIQAAIEGYESGAIGASTRYTLIWAGRIVDTCPTYTSFTRDRAARLDGYARRHGPGWLWWEPPLVGERATVPLKKGICLPNPESGQDPLHPGHFKIRMGYRRIRYHNCRDGTGAPVPPPRGWHHPLPPPAHVRPRPYAPDATAPQLFFTVLLDSGASFPVLFTSDLSACGIDLVSYAASSALNISGIDSTSIKRAYEMEARVYPSTATDYTGVIPPALQQHFRDASCLADAPGSSNMSCITPVVSLDAGGRELAAAGGGFSFHRLSGMVPWLVCYTSSAPGMGCMWVGPQRSDVLGSHRLPGEVLRPGWVGEWASASKAPSLRQLNPYVAAGLVTPTGVRFEHALDGGGRLVDEDSAGLDGLSVVRVIDGLGREESRWVDAATGREGRDAIRAEYGGPPLERQEDERGEPMEGVDPPRLVGQVKPRHHPRPGPKKKKRRPSSYSTDSYVDDSSSGSSSSDDRRRPRRQRRRRNRARMVVGEDFS